LEALGREPYAGRKDDTWGKHIVLISGVSGGSLGTARFVHALTDPTWQEAGRIKDLRYTGKDDLAYPTDEKRRTLQAMYDVDWTDNYSGLTVAEVQKLLDRPDAEREKELISHGVRFEELEQVTRRAKAFKDAKHFCEQFGKNELTDQKLSWCVESALGD